MLMAATAQMAKPIGEWFRAFLGVAFAAVWVFGGPASTAAPLQLVTDRWIPYENLSDAEAPGFSTEVLKQVFVSMGQQASFEEFPWARAAGLVFREEQRALIGDDPFPLGLAAMGRNIERAIQGSVEQGLLRRPLSLADIFYRTTLLT